jgi:hypothetical protein
MYKPLLLLVLLLFTFSTHLFAQIVSCDTLQKKSIAKISRDYTYAKTFPMAKKTGEPATAALVMSEGSTYCIKFTVSGGDKSISEEGIILNLVNNGNIIASSYNKVTLRYQDGFIIKCDKTGMYYFNFEARNKDKKQPICGYISIGFRRNN